ncbi:hypothetical protein [Pleurocapsa sp. PCC 7319]|uniref:hypothetical protein n=1 Tax=Pleurocapsa sp. PCC 7319 TaxID=118161 RepID=UPI000346D099|nr:hypothetical protein [Pleurocapsa sp. PCC 7319]
MTDKMEQNKPNLTNYYSQLSEIEAKANKEKELLANAIEAEQAEIKSLLEEYQRIKQQKEIDVIKASLDKLSDFKQQLLSKIKSEIETSDAQYFQDEFGPEIPDLDDSTDSTSALAAGDTDAKKLEAEQNNQEEVGNGETLAQLIEFIDRTTHQELVKLYPANVTTVVPNFNVHNAVVREQLLEHYQQQNANTYNALIKLYQKPDIKYQVNIPNIQDLEDEDRKYHEFLLINYPNALPFFWFLVNREPDSIKYAVMEFAMDHIIQTNTIDTENVRHELALSLNELISMNNGESLTDFLRDLFVCFHPQRASKKNNSTNKYFDYINNLIKLESTLEHSRILQIWNYMNQSGYDAVSSTDFSFAPLNISNNENGFISTANEITS